MEIWKAWNQKILLVMNVSFSILILLLLYNQLFFVKKGMGIVESVGSNVKNIKVGDRVVVSAPIACGQCECKSL